MHHPTDLYELAQLHQAEIRKQAAEDRLIRVARRSRYARSGSGRRFIRAGEPLFQVSPEPPRVA